MKNPLIIILILMALLPVQGSGQCNVKGTVRDKRTGEPLPFANIFLNRTTFGAAADEKGNFIFSFPSGTYEIKASYIGYETDTGIIHAGEGEKFEVSFALKVEKKALSEVEVKGTRDKKWLRMYRKFEREFLGTTKNSRGCTVLNPWVVEFQEDEKADWQIHAYSTVPIEVQNNALGYKVYFLLKQLVVFSNRMSYYGDARFETLEPKSEEEKNLWIQNRMIAYSGSDRHLFRSIITGKMEAEGFRLYSELTMNKELVRPANFSQVLGKTVIPYSLHLMPIIGKTKSYRVPMDSRLEIHYKNDAAVPFYKDIFEQISWMESAQPSILVSEMGVPLNPSEITMNGYFRLLRVGDMLPDNYRPGQ